MTPIVDFTIYYQDGTHDTDVALDREALDVARQHYLWGALLIIAFFPDGTHATWQWLKPCRCGRTHTRPQWQLLPRIGHMPGDAGKTLELRNCQCKSTLAIEL